MSNILDSIKVYITPELLAETAKVYDESEVGISKTIGSFAPSILLGLLEKCGDSHSLDNIFNRLRNFDPAILDHLDSLLDDDNQAHKDSKDGSEHLLGIIFGAKMPAIINAVASFSGVRQSSAASLLGLSGPLVMALLSNKINGDGLNPSGFVSYLLRYRPTIISLLPAGVGSLLGAVNIGNGRSAAEEKTIAGIGWFWPLLLLVILGIAVVYFLKNTP